MFCYQLFQSMIHVATKSKVCRAILSACLRHFVQLKAHKWHFEQPEVILPMEMMGSKSSQWIPSSLLLFLLPAAWTFRKKMTPRTAIPKRVIRSRARGMPGQSL